MSDQSMNPVVHKNQSQYVFSEGEDGCLKLVGDFEGLYANIEDPWEQSGEGNTPMTRYYAASRAKLISSLRRRIKLDCHGLEVGCGHGHVTSLLQQLAPIVDWIGIDVSTTAVAKAHELYPHIKFLVRDITEFNIYLTPRSYDVVVLGQVLWYLLPKLDVATINCHALLKSNGLLVISQAFLKEEQRYGRDIVDGFDGAVKYFMNSGGFSLLEARLSENGSWAHDDGLIILRAK